MSSQRKPKCSHILPLLCFSRKWTTSVVFLHCCTSFFRFADRVVLCTFSKGEIEPIQVKVTVGARRGRTEITGFEPFLIIDGEEMADRMRKICAGSTSSKLSFMGSLMTK